MPIITSIEDLRLLAKRRVPRMFYDYVDSGSWTESTYRSNTSAFDDIHFRQRVGVRIGNRSLNSAMAGQAVSMPVALAPTGLAGMQFADGEILAARAAERFGVPFTLSTVSICSIEDIAAHTSQPFWFQLYMMKDRDFIGRLVERAQAAKCAALVLTLDLQIQGQRHKDLKNGLTVPPKPTLANMFNMMLKPRWCMRMLGTRRRAFGNIVGHVADASDMSSFASWVSRQFDPEVSWEDVKWLRRRWKGKLIIKGVMDVEDARHAVECGADAVIVSNHGGRQLDGAPPAIAVLPRIAEAVGHRIEVHMDSGIRTGQDVLKALALGAKGVYIGRAFLYGLGALGEPGVTQCLEILRKELDLTMAFCGVTDIRHADRQILYHGAAQEALFPAVRQMPVAGIS
jgi:L-lactate dehydrogenase (cytochrome)